MSTAVTDINALVVLNEWALANSHPAPVYHEFDNTVTIAGVEAAQVQAVLATADSAQIADAQKRVVIRAFQIMNPPPKNATLAQSKGWALTISKQVIGYLRARSTRDADAVTLAGWVDKLNVAKAVVAGNATPEEVLILQTEADTRALNESAEVLAGKIVAKAGLLRAARSKIDGFEHRLLREINAVVDVPSFSAVLATMVTDGSAIIAELSA